MRAPSIMRAYVTFDSGLGDIVEFDLNEPLSLYAELPAGVRSVEILSVDWIEE